VCRKIKPQCFTCIGCHVLLLNFLADLEAEAPQPLVRLLGCRSWRG